MLHREEIEAWDGEEIVETTPYIVTIASAKH